MDKQSLDKFTTLILVNVQGDLNSIYSSPFKYEVGSFNVAGIDNIHDFNELINSLYRSSPICEGIGYYEYCNQIKESIYFCLKDDIKASFIIPLRKNHKTHYFLMNINKSENGINALFVYFDNSKIYNFEEFSSGTFKDALTGLFNYKTLVTHISDNKRRGFLCLFDLNKFKPINDELGHEMGDKVLISIAKYLISISSMNEVFYRRSGDEFMILVFEQDINYVISLIQRIEEHIENLTNELHKDIHTSAAFGILELAIGSSLDYEMQSKLTDLAMYQAKKSHKLYHYITHEDAINIIAKGDLDSRISEIAKEIKR